MKRILLMFIVSIFAVAVLAAGNFEIEEYSIDIVAAKNGNLHIREDISVRFLEESHGIYRDIQHEFDNPNGNSFDPIEVTISNVKATSLYKTEDEDGMLRLILGDPDSYSDERERYIIEYDYAMDWDRDMECDELYYNLISPAWDTTIRNIRWRVTLPYPVDKENIRVTEGKSGSYRKGSFTLSGNNTVIEGEKEILLPQSAITLKVLMEEGYWKGFEARPDNSIPYLYTALIIAVAMAISSAVVWFLFGHDNYFRVTCLRTIPPTGMNPMEAGFMVDQSMSVEKEGFSMVFKWAEEGKVKIKEEVGEDGKSNFTFTKLQEPTDDAPKSERTLFSLFFFKDSVTLTDLVSHNFPYDFSTKVLKALTEERRNDKDRKSVKLQHLFLVLLSISLVASGILLSMKYPGLMSLLFVLILLLAAFFTMLIFGLWSDGGKTWKKSTKAIVFSLLGVVILGGGILIFAMISEAKFTVSAVFTSLISYTLFIVSSVFSALMDKRSPEGQEKLQECLEYREYLAAMERGEVAPDSAARDMWGTHMAYALAFGIEFKNEKMDLELPQPYWYEGNGWRGNWITYYLLFHSCHTSYSSSVMTVSKTSPGGSGIGTGFSGGGFSGGGGGSW